MIWTPKTTIIIIKISAAPSIKNSAQLKLDSSFESDSLELPVEQPDNVMLRLRNFALRIRIR